MRAALAAGLAIVLLGGCRAAEGRAVFTGGDAKRGKQAIAGFGCGACHEIPEVAAARGKVGPPLEGFASRVYIAGVWPNTPENLMAFIREPRRADPRTAMPDLGVTEAHARDMVAYLYTLE